MAKSGLRHIDVGPELTKTEWESEESHELVHGTSFPSSPVERQLFYRDDEHKWYIYNGSEWIWLGGGSGGGMQVHGNEYHDPHFASEADVYKVVTSPIIYNIGSGQDFETIAAAAQALRSLILEADITLKLTENVTETALVEILGQISMGGFLRIELNGKTWTLSGDLSPKIFVGGLANVVLQTEYASGGTVSVLHPSPSGKMVVQVRQYSFVRWGWTAAVTVNLNNLALYVFLFGLDNSKLYSHSLTCQNYANVERMYNGALNSYFSMVTAFPTPWVLAAGAMIVDQNGDIWTKKGQVT
jgi:hypothetical protein